MEPRESIVFYSSFFEAIDSLPEENQAECYRAVMRYGLYGEEPEPGSLGYTMFLAFRKQIDVNQKRFENSKKKPNRDQTTTKQQPNRNQTATKRRPNSNQTTTKPPANVNVNVNENVNENENVNVSSNEDITPLSSDEDNSSAKPTRVPYQEVVEKFNEICLSLPQVQKLTPARRQAIKGRCSEYSVPEIVDVFRRAENSDFLSGRNGNWNGCSFDWLMKPANFLKVLEGNYENKSSPDGPDGFPETNNPFLRMLWEEEHK